MKILRKVMFVAFALVLFQSTSSQATLYEMIITDYELQKFLANNGIDVRSFYQNDSKANNNNDNDDNNGSENVELKNDENNLAQSSLIDQAKKLLTEKYEKFHIPDSIGFTSQINFPNKRSELAFIVHQIMMIPVCTEVNNNNDSHNLLIFNEQLSNHNVHKKEVSAVVIIDRFSNYLKKLKLVDFSAALADVIFSYFTAQKIEQITPGGERQVPHLYVKFVLDTEEEKITLLATPNQSQDGFTRIYDFENGHEVKKDDKCLIS